MCRPIVVGLIVAFSCASVAHAQSRASVLWTVSGAGAGFGIGLWAGLSAFDQSVNSDRKVWTSAVVGAGVGATAGYLVWRTRRDRQRPSLSTPVANRNRPEHMADPRLLEQVAKTVWFARVRRHDAEPAQPGY